MAGKNEIKEEYTSSLADLTFNSKPLISVLTMLAEEYIAHAKDIVEAIEAHLSRVRTEVKLPVLYLIDSIIKNLGGPYTTLFCQNIVSTFCTVFEQVDERTRAEMFRLRQTWNDVIPPKKLYSLDIQIKELDPAWPVTAPPPSNIHFNPKFFKSNTTSTLTKIKNTASNTSASKSDLLLPNTNNSLDEKTLTMQQKLIDKQRQLLELQQRKLELELLQTQVKLQEQLKTTSTGGPTGTTTTTSTVGAPSKNLLLKPEVAKQLSIPTNQTKLSPAIRSKGGPHTVSSVMNARLNQGNSSYPTSRITPVQGNLAKARPPIRDPRLLRHQQHEQQQQQFQTAQQIAPNSKTNNNTNVHLENKSKSLVNNKGNIESHGKSKTLPHSSPLKHTQKIGSLPRKAAKFPQVNKSPGSSSTVNVNAADLKGSSSSSLSSSSKSSSKSDSSLKKRSTGKSSIKSKKKRTESAITESGAFSNKESTLLRYNKGDKSASVPFHSDKDSSVILHKKIAKHSSNKSELKDKSQLSKSENASFKDLKGLTKNRNYMRRNRNTSVSPELNQDVDLRLGVPPEKQPRLQSDIMEDKHVVTEGSNDVSESKDVDLRRFNPPMTKKRTSEDSNESPNSKKSKTKMFDVLFGSEDIDLRQLPPPVVLSPKGSDRPPTPPPPIISENNKSSEIPVDKIIISPADEECIKTGNMTEAQKNALMNKIIAQIEGQKLREAKRKDTESFKQTINISLQPISDDELEADFSGDESTKTDSKRIISPNNRVLHEDESVYDNRSRDREDRIIPQQSQSEEPFNKYSRGMDHRDSRSNRLWRGGRFRQKVWDNPPTGPIPRPPIPPLLRPGPPDLWLRQMNDWRGMCPPTGPMFQQNFSPDIIPNNMPPHLMNQEGGHSPNSNFHDIPSLEYSPPNSFTFITIDHEPREVRYYDEIAIVFMSAGDPREIAFHDGMRRIFFDGEPHLLKFNHPYEDILIKGKIHKVRLGTPSREIFIDGKGYQCYFDGNEKTIELDGNTVMVKLELPPPRVNIGQDKRLDLVAGKIQLVVDAKNITTIFLDGKLQTFEVDGIEHTLKFVDALRGVLIDGTRYDVEFGGLPKPFMLHDKKHFIRFSVLPKGVKPGRVCIKDMEVCQPYDSPKNDTENSQDGFSNLIMPVDMAASTKNQSNPLGSHSPERNSNSPCSQNFMQQPNFNNLDMLSSVLSSSMISSSAEGGYNVENSINTDSSQNTQTNSTNIPVASVQQSSVKPAININELFQRLVATGIVTTSAPPSQPEQTPIYAPPSKPSRNIINFKQVKPVDFSKPETLKLRRVPIIQALHIGMQCSSCGMRFPPEQSMYYSQHLDWHFRQNRRGKRNIRKASNRRWYYNFSDWKNYEELENLEEREKSYFENQQASQNEASNEDGEEEIEIPCVPADPNVQNAVCEVCQDKFEQFYNEEKDEWQLRMAIRMDDKTYHPLCYEDYQSSFMDETTDDNKTDLITEHETNLSSGGIPLLEVPNKESSAKDNENIENDVDDVMEVIENIDDDEDDDGSLKEENKFEEVPPEDDDDDVILNEVIPERIVVDDDDKDDYEPSNHDNTFIPEIVIKEEPIDDGFMDIGIDVVKTKSDIVKIKTEPPDTYEPEPKTLAVDSADTTHIEVVSSMDGNVELDMGVPTSSGISGKIKINISKPIPTIVQKENKGIVNEELNIDSIDPSQPLPPGEEPVQLNVKPALKGLELKRQPVVKKGSELTGLCSIM